MTIRKDVAELTEDDIGDHPVWEYVSDHDHLAETIMTPVVELPITHLVGRVVGTHVVLACGVRCPAILGGLDLRDPELNKYSLQISFIKGATQIFFAADSGICCSASEVAHFLGHEVEDVFPISYDISRHCVGNSASLSGSIPSQTLPVMKSDERMQMALKIARRGAA